MPHLDSNGGGVSAYSPFLVDATFHVLSSSAVFVVRNPCRNGTVTIESIFATAYYNGTVIGNIDVDDFGWVIVPGVSNSPYLPVNFSLSDVTRELLKKALGRTLYIDAFARVGFSIDNLEDVYFNYTASGVGSNIRL